VEQPGGTQGRHAQRSVLTRVADKPLSAKRQLTKPGNPAQNVAEGAAKLVGELYRQSNGSMPVAIMAPATMILMCEGLDFLSKMKGAQITPQLLAQATQNASQGVLQLLGVSQQKLHQVVAQGMHQAHARLASSGVAMQVNAARAQSGMPPQQPVGIINRAMRRAR